MAKSKWKGGDGVPLFSARVCSGKLITRGRDDLEQSTIQRALSADTVFC